MSTIEQFNKYVMPSYGRYDLVLDSGSGRQAVDLSLIHISEPTRH